VSNDLLLLSLDQNLQSLAALRGSPPLLAAIVCFEDDGTDPFDALGPALAEYIRGTAGDVGVVGWKPFCTGVGGHTYAQAVYSYAAVLEPDRSAVWRGFGPVGQRMSGLIRELPDDTRRRLGIGELYGTPVEDWVWVLFHLAWHFPDHFARGAVCRCRWLTTDDRPFVAPEQWLQLGGVVSHATDRYPGLIFSCFPHQLDLVSATGHAIELIRCAVRGGGGFRVSDTNRDHLRRVHQEFAAIGNTPTRRSNAESDPDVRVLRLDNSFRTPPAARWAGYQEGGDTQQTLALSLRRGVREVCVLRGPSVGDFTRRADRAGALLPAWAEYRAAPLLEDADNWLTRVTRRRELASEQYYFATEDGSPPGGVPVPLSTVIRHYWESTRPSAHWGETVTDHRGNVERWLGFVFYVLKEYDPDSVEVRRASAGRTDYRGWNAVLTLRGMNVYQASARAMELAGWVWAESGEGGTAPTARNSGAAGGKPAEGIYFDDPWQASNYPPPAAGRYIRYHVGDPPAGREPEWRLAWTWADKPGDGWVEGHPVATAAGWVPLGCGSPPAVCDWLPPDWGADYFPLGSTAEHCEAWRALCRTVLVEMPDTLPPDHTRFGWRTITRATRHLAHHLRVISIERVVAPLPATRDDAWREVEPLLDGLLADHGTTARGSGHLSGAGPGPGGGPSARYELSPSQTAAFRHAFALLADAAIGLVPFGARSRAIADASATWDAWRKEVVEIAVLDAEVALTGLLDRFPDAPHRNLPSELRDLWLRVRCWGTGRASTWEEFDGAANRAEWSALTGGIERFLRRVRLLFLYLGLEPCWDAGGTDADMGGGMASGATGAAEGAIDPNERAILVALLVRHPVLMKLVDVETAARLSKQTVGDAVQNLLAKKFVHRPSGVRKGAGLTAEGLVLARRLHNSTDNHP
jgi:hypothetical protein